MAGKPRNIVILHLESVSAMRLWHYRNHMGTIWRLMESSLAFSRFHTTATSTAMVVYSVFTGAPSALDHTAKFAVRTPPPGFPWHGWGVHRFGMLDIRLMSSPLTGEVENETPHRLFINSSNVSTLVRRGCEVMEKCRREGRPFCLYLWDASSHMAFSGPVKNSMADFEQRMAAGYTQIDLSAKTLLAHLMRLGLWDDTIIVGFGDHGDELWNHGLNRGYCHCQAPYATLTHTPFFIHGPDIQPLLTDKLACSDDVKQTVLGMVYPNIPETVSPFRGVDLSRHAREYVFSNNLLPLQEEYSDPEQGLTKAYAVTDGTYRLVVTTGGARPESGGMELFCDPLDPMNSRNLLDFFQLENDAASVRFAPPAAMRSQHFAAAMHPGAVAEIAAKYAELRPVLLQYIRGREAFGLQYFQGTEKHLFPDHPFHRIRKRRLHVTD